MTAIDGAKRQSWGAPAPIMIFAATAHFLHHVLLSLYVTLVLVLAGTWGMAYGDLIALWTLGSMMVGLGAPLAGWLADRWGETKLMIILFFGLGGTSILCGLAGGPVSMEIALTLLGIFGAIYHPVGNAWVVHHASEPGKAVASAGIAGSFGVAAGPILAGLFSDLIDWRAAFIVPGVVSLLFGVALAVAYARGAVTDSRSAPREAAPQTIAAPSIRQFLVLMGATMTLTLIAYNAFATALPKFIAHATQWDASDLTAIGLAVGAIHLGGSFAQFAGGHFADRGATRFSYSLSFLVLAVVLALAAVTQGWLLVPVAIATLFIFEMVSPLETLLVARVAPPTRRGLFFGFRYALSIVGAPAGVAMVAALYDPSTGFTTLMFCASAIALLTFAVSLLLPRDGSEGMPLPIVGNFATFQGTQAQKPPPAE